MAVLIAILLPLVLLGFGALVIDVGSLYSERRQLQNGADAGALALAQVCAAGSCDGGGMSASARAADFANQNSKDDQSNVKEVCGQAPGLSPCATVPSGVPAGANYVKVTTQTGTTAGPSLMPAILGKAVESSYDGKTVSATAVAAYGPASGLLSGLPVTVSICEWSKYTANGTVFGAPPYTASMEHTLYLHTTTSTNTPVGCKSGPSGADVPGGFGWLATTSSECAAFSDVDGSFPDDPGVSVDKVCKAALDKLLNTTIYIPIFDTLTGTGANGKYGMAGFAAFYLTGWNLPGTSQNSTLTPPRPGTAYCKGSDKCLYGVFTKPLEPADGAVGGGGADFGVKVFQLVG